MSAEVTACGPAAQAQSAAIIPVASHFIAPALPGNLSENLKRSSATLHLPRAIVM
ncbi:MAG: hypothetical protein KDA53_16270 [Hyphomonas sp.]|nr:hypothetical protein [Hyphomonas sp.]